MVGCVCLYVRVIMLIFVRQFSAWGLPGKNLNANLFDVRLNCVCVCVLILVRHFRAWVCNANCVVPSAYCILLVFVFLFFYSHLGFYSLLSASAPIDMVRNFWFCCSTPLFSCFFPLTWLLFLFICFHSLFSLCCRRVAPAPRQPVVLFVLVVVMASWWS